MITCSHRGSLWPPCLCFILLLYGLSVYSMKNWTWRCMLVHFCIILHTCPLLFVFVCLFIQRKFNKDIVKKHTCMRNRGSQTGCYNCCIWKQASYYTVEQCSTQQAENRASLLKIIGCEMFLASQGLAFRGHEHHQGNLDQLLKYKAEDDQSISWSLSVKSGVYTSWDCQNERINSMSSSIIRKIAD